MFSNIYAAGRKISARRDRIEVRQQSSIKTAPATPRCHKFAVSRMDFDQQRLEYRVDTAGTILIERDKAFDFPCWKRDTVCQRSLRAQEIRRAVCKREITNG